MQDQFAGLGLEVELEDEVESDVIEVWDTNWPALRAFLASATQWRVVSRGMSGVLTYLGLDYAALDRVLERQGADASVFDDVRVMEVAAIDAFVEAAAEDAR